LHAKVHLSNIRIETYLVKITLTFFSFLDNTDFG